MQQTQEFGLQTNRKKVRNSCCHFKKCVKCSVYQLATDYQYW